MIKRPWPSSMRTLANDHDRFQKTYFEHYKGYYFTGDGCRRDKDGYYWLTGTPTECTSPTRNKCSHFLLVTMVVTVVKEE